MYAALVLSSEMGQQNGMKNASGFPFIHSGKKISELPLCQRKVLQKIFQLSSGGGKGGWVGNALADITLHLSLSFDN